MGFFLDVLFPKLLGGFIVTLKILCIAIPVSIPLGILVATARVYGNKPISLIAAGYVFLFRGTPLIVQLLILFFAITTIGIHLTPFWAAVIGFILCSTAYQSEYVRGAILSVEKGQSMAARSLGMSKLKEIRHIILPQACRRALPGVSNEIIYLIKYSSLAFVIGVPEMFSISKSLNSIYFLPLVIFGCAGLFFLVMTTAATIGFNKLEKKLKIPGLETAA